MIDSRSLESKRLENAKVYETEVTIYMVNGFQLHGLIVEHDDVSILIMDNKATGKVKLLYKQNISTIEF